MSTVQVALSEKIWQDLVSVGQEEAISPDTLLKQAVEHFLLQKKDRPQSRIGLQESFGIWEKRDDLNSDSVDIVNELRGEWDEREQRLGLA